MRRPSPYPGHLVGMFHFNFCFLFFFLIKVRLIYNVGFLSAALFHFLIWLLLPEPRCVLFHGYCYFGSVKSFLK